MINVCIVTTARSDFGILKPLISKLEKSKKFKPLLLVSGNHSSNFFGKTLKEIKNDKIKNYKVIKLNIKNKKEHTLNISGEIFNKFVNFFKSKNFDLIILLGDRFEILPIANLAVLKNIPIAHIHGGEITEGVIDEYIRHAVTKLSSLHFATNIEYKKRIIRMGESPKNVFLVGHLGIDFDKKSFLINKELFKQKIGIFNNNKIICIAIHPEIKNKNFKKNIDIFFNFMKKISDSNHNLIITYPNMDPGFNYIIKKIIKLKKKKNVFVFKNLGHKLFLSMLNHSQIIIGNSSSGILEAPYFKTFSINLGNRQKGRVKPKTVIDCDYNYNQLNKKFNNLINKNKPKTIDKKFYLKGSASNKIINILSKLNLSHYKTKKFCD